MEPKETSNSRIVATDFIIYLVASIFIIGSFIYSYSVAHSANQYEGVTVTPDKQVDISLLMNGISEAKLITGPEIEVAEISQNPLLVTFYASWCPPCTAEFIELNKLKGLVETQNLSIVAINIHEELFKDKNGRMQRFLKRTNPNFTVLGEAPIAAQAFGGVPRIPTVYLFNDKQELIYSFVHLDGAQKSHVTAEEIKTVLTKNLNLN